MIDITAIGNEGRGEEQDVVSPTVRELIGPYVAQRLARHEIGPMHARNTRMHLYAFADHAGARPVNRLHAELVRSWLETDHAPGTLRVRLSTVRTFLGWCVERGYCRTNVAVQVKGPRLPRALPRALPSDKTLSLFDVVPDRRGVLILMLMLQQGLRCVSVARLRIEDIDRTNRTILTNGKGGHQKLLPLMDETFDALEDYLAEHPAPAGPLIRSYNNCRRGIGAHRIGVLVAGWMKDAGLKRHPWDGVSAHACRHTAARDMLLAGAHIRDVQNALDHMHLATTERYLPLEVRGLAEAMGGRSYRQG